MRSCTGYIRAKKVITLSSYSSPVSRNPGSWKGWYDFDPGQCVERSRHILDLSIRFRGYVAKSKFPNLEWNGMGGMLDRHVKLPLEACSVLLAVMPENGSAGVPAVDAVIQKKTCLRYARWERGINRIFHLYK